MPALVNTLENVLAWRVTGLDQSSSQIDRFFSNLESRKRRAGQRTDFGAQAGAGGLSNLDRVTGNLDKIQTAERLVGGAAIAGAAGIGVLINKAAGMEQIQIAFEGLLGSADGAKKKLDELQQFANHSPFNFRQVAEGSQQLLAAGANANDLIPILTALGNANARSGLGQDAFNRSLYATSQILNEGKLRGDELRQLEQAGVPANAVLAKLGTTYDQVGNKAITAQQFTKALVEVMTTGSFTGAMERQGKTLNGTFSTLQDSVEQLETSLGKGLAPAAVFVVQGLTKIIDAANALPEPVKNLGGLLGGGLVLAAGAAWVGLKALEVQHKRLLDRMIEVTLAAGPEALALKAAGTAAGAGAGAGAAGGAAGAAGTAAKKGGGFLGTVGKILGTGAFVPRVPGNMDRLEKLYHQLFGGTAPDRSQGAGKPAPAQTAEQKTIELLQKQLEEMRKQTGMMQGSASVSTSEVALYRQLAGRRVVQYGT